jgi:hypothetical protein
LERLPVKRKDATALVNELYIAEPSFHSVAKGAARYRVVLGVTQIIVDAIDAVVGPVLAYRRRLAISAPLLGQRLCLLS